MAAAGIIVIDLGKTMSKASLCDARGAVIARRERANASVSSGGRRILDVVGIEDWLIQALRELGALAPVKAIVPVAHGAAAAIIRDGALVHPPLDYEQPMPDALMADYRRQRDDFAVSGSPALGDGLNLGAQLHALETIIPDLWRGTTQILPWAQYWSWRLSGVAASEVSSLGSHTDLWAPFEGRPSPLADRRGWTGRLAPLRRAGDMIGRLRADWADRTGLSPTVAVLCGVHDSNAALLAARGFPQVGDGEATVLSTGTWFVAMRTGGTADMAVLDAKRDCLVNVDTDGRPVPSGRFMGGREIAVLAGDDPVRIDDPLAQADIAAALDEVMASGAMIVPTMAAGAGPFPDRIGRWINRPASPIARAATIALYAALVADVTLDLIGSRERIVVEGRFSRAQAFVRALASLRLDMAVFVADGDLDLAFGACRLVDPALPPPCRLDLVSPLDVDILHYRARWRESLDLEVAA